MTPEQKDEFIEKTKELLYSIQTIHLDMSGYLKYALSVKSHVLIGDLKLMLLMASKEKGL